MDGPQVEMTCTQSSLSAMFTFLFHYRGIEHISQQLLAKGLMTIVI